MEKTLDLGPFRQEIAALTRAVADTQAALNTASANLTAFKDSAKARICKLIEEGHTTGDPLLDECLCIFGFEDQVSEKILALNEQLKGAAGQRCLLTFKWETRVRFGGPGDLSERDYVTSTGYVYGTLSGERLKISLNSAVSSAVYIGIMLSFPFNRFVTRCLERDPTPGKAKKGEPFILTNRGGLEGPDIYAFLQSLIEKRDDNQVIAIDPDPATIPHGFEEDLNAATEDEAHSAEHI